MKLHPVDLLSQEQSRRKAGDYDLEYVVRDIVQVAVKLAVGGELLLDG
jgi:hypothetical protein